MQSTNSEYGSPYLATHHYIYIFFFMIQSNVDLLEVVFLNSEVLL